MAAARCMYVYTRNAFVPIQPWIHSADRQSASLASYKLQYVYYLLTLVRLLCVHFGLRCVFPAHWQIYATILLTLLLLLT